MKIKLVYVTFPNLQIAQEIAQKLLIGKLIACANIEKIESIYEWENEIQNDVEYKAIFKTSKSKLKHIKRFIKENHPYQTPFIAQWTVNVNKSYGEWIKKQIQP
jgi:periplasmic divalent cation tolerance protein